MIYIKSILAGLAAIAGTAIGMILAVTIAWWRLIGGESGGIVRHVFATGRSVTFAATVVGIVALLIFTLGFCWEFRRDNVSLPVGQEYPLLLLVPFP